MSLYPDDKNATRSGTGFPLLVIVFAGLVIIAFLVSGIVSDSADHRARVFVPAGDVKTAPAAPQNG